jgi:3-oxoacyl-[acyl-carrier-protein] synthase-3
MFRTVIRSLGHCVPDRKVTNKDLEKWMDTSDEWIIQRSGIKERRWASPGDLHSQLSLKAAQEALDRAGWKADDVDAIVFACIISDYVFPGGGVLLQRDLGGARTIPALDIRNQCSAIPYGLQVADAWIRSGFYKKVLLVGAEVQTTSMDVTTRGRDISVLFGDGAGAMTLEASSDPTQGIIDTIVHSEGRYAEKLCILHPSPNDHPRMSESPHYDAADIYPHMDGKFVFKNAVTRMPEVVQEILAKNHLTVNDVDFVIAHQANLRINQMVLEQLGIPAHKTHNTLEHYGNTTAATIPLTMNEAVELGKIKRGDLVILLAFGSGFTWGATLLRY